MSNTPPTIRRHWLRDVIAGDRLIILLAEAIKIGTVDDAFDLLFDKDMFSLIETKTNHKKRKKIEASTKHKEHLLESSK